MCCSAATGPGFHLGSHCLLPSWNSPLWPPGYFTGRLTCSAICSPLLPSWSVVLPYCEKTPGDVTSSTAWLTCWPAQTRERTQKRTHTITKCHVASEGSHKNSLSHHNPSCSLSTCSFFGGKKHSRTNNATHKSHIPTHVFLFVFSSMTKIENSEEWHICRWD